MRLYIASLLKLILRINKNKLYFVGIGEKARVVKLVDTQRSERCTRKGVEVQILSRAPHKNTHPSECFYVVPAGV